MPHSMADHNGPDVQSRLRLTWLVSAACVLLAFGFTTARAGTNRSHVDMTPQWSVSTDEAPSFLSESTLELAMSDSRFAVQGWRWSRGTFASIAVLVRVESLRCISLARVGGIYGP